MNTPIDPANIKARECKHVVYCGKPQGTDSDLHFVKEVIHTHDGKLIPNTFLWHDFQRDIYVTKKGFQNHNSKKEWEDLDRLNRYSTTQANIDRTIANALGRPGFTGNPRKLRDSQFLYGSDIKSQALIKHKINSRNPDAVSFNTVSVFDVETNVVDESGHIIMATLSFGDRVCTVVDKKFVSGIANPEQRCREALQKYLGSIKMYHPKEKEWREHDLVKERNINWELIFVDSEIQVVIEIFKRAHEWKPDFMTIWNMTFDIEKVIEACNRAGIDPAFIFSDPSVPYQYRYFNYIKGKAQKVTAGGKVTPVKRADRWHTVEAPASFYVTDSMCVYRRIRTALGDEPSFALDDILTKEKMPRKLKFKEAEEYQDVEWHIFMQTNYPIEYIIYNVFDCICVELMDEKTKDLAVAMPSRCGYSDYADYKSQPRMAVDDLHFVCLQNNKVIGTVSSDMVEEVDDDFDLKNWIVNLAAHLITKEGLKIIEEYPDLVTRIYIHVADLDVSASYPNGGVAFNISKETTLRELIEVIGVDPLTTRMMTINLSGGATNSLEICHKLLKMPSLNQLLDAFIEDECNVIEATTEAEPEPTIRVVVKHGEPQPPTVVRRSYVVRGQPEVEEVKEVETV